MLPVVKLTGAIDKAYLIVQLSLSSINEGTLMTTKQFQCATFLAPGRTCRFFEGHEGPHEAEVKMNSEGGWECSVCGKKFASPSEFDDSGHAPCPKTLDD
jgi:hypothetical protein